jgi:hypothetical protein
MALVSPRKQALRLFTVGAGILSMVAGGAIYFQVSGLATAMWLLAGTIAPADSSVTDGSAGQTVQAPAYNPNPGYGRPIAVTGGS